MFDTIKKQPHYIKLNYTKGTCMFDIVWI